ncbi:MAG: phage tail protein [Pseudonocardiaceae bacterium]
MPLPDLDKAVGHSFGLEIDGVQIKQIQEVSGLKMEQDVIELKQNMSQDGKYSIKKLPGRFKAGEVTFTRGLTDDTSFEKWIKDSRFGKMAAARKNGSVTVFDYEGKSLKRYKLTNCWPKSLEIGTMKAGDTSVLTEKLVVTYESLDPE